MEESRMKIAILYIATGPYIKFWPHFYETFQKYFCSNYERNYYVFTDSENDSIFQDIDNVTVIHIDNLPWPLVTLMRFRYFNSIQEEIKKNDYVLFSNANIECCRRINFEEIFGNEDLFFTQHPGYLNVSPKYYVLERNKKSTAYVPYRCQKKYVIGAFFGGRVDAFLTMSNILERNIEEDLKRNYIARWHDESHINCYYNNYQNAKILSPSYCYPFGFDLEIQKCIAAVDKQSVFDVRSFKGYDTFEVNYKDIAYARLLQFLHKCDCNLKYLIGA